MPATKKARDCGPFSIWSISYTNPGESSYSNSFHSLILIPKFDILQITGYISGYRFVRIYHDAIPKQGS